VKLCIAAEGLGMGQNDEEILSVLDEIGDLLRVLESRDTVIYEKVDLTEYLPSLSGPAPIMRSRQSKRALIDPESLRASINAAKKGKKAAASGEPKVKEKDDLIRKREALQKQIESQLKIVAELEKHKSRLEQQLMDVHTRIRLGSRSQIGTEEFEPPNSSSSEELSLAAEDWKSKYDAMEKKYRYLTDAHRILNPCYHICLIRRLSSDMASQRNGTENLGLFDIHHNYQQTLGL
jgi:hypothetical protein